MKPTGRTGTSSQTWEPRSSLAARNAAPFQSISNGLPINGSFSVRLPLVPLPNDVQGSCVPFTAGRKGSTNRLIELAENPVVIGSFFRPGGAAFLGERFAAVAPLFEQPRLPLEPRDQGSYLGAVPVGSDFERGSRNRFNQIPQDGLLGGITDAPPRPSADGVRWQILNQTIHFPPLHVLEDRAGLHFKPIQDDRRNPAREHLAVLLGSHLGFRPHDDREQGPLDSATGQRNTANLGGSPFLRRLAGGFAFQPRPFRFLPADLRLARAACTTSRIASVARSTDCRTGSRVNLA